MVGEKYMRIAPVVFSFQVYVHGGIDILPSIQTLLSANLMYSHTFEALSRKPLQRNLLGSRPLQPTRCFNSVAVD